MMLIIKPISSAIWIDNGEDGLSISMVNDTSTLHQKGRKVAPSKVGAPPFAA